jgi:hypothetical protein
MKSDCYWIDYFFWGIIKYSKVDCGNGYNLYIYNLYMCMCVYIYIYMNILKPTVSYISVKLFKNLKFQIIIKDIKHIMNLDFFSFILSFFFFLFFYETRSC